jgi:flavodoxin
MTTILILFGSQTGEAKDVASRIGREAIARRFVPRVIGMDEYKVTDLPTEHLILFITSTTGQGDPPDNMRSFWSFLLRKSLPLDSLSNSSFAVFGLGDSGYAKYNVVAKRLDARLAGLGGQRILPLGLGDDQDRYGYDQVLSVQRCIRGAGKKKCSSTCSWTATLAPTAPSAVASAPPASAPVLPFFLLLLSDGHRFHVQLVWQLQLLETFTFTITSCTSSRTNTITTLPSAFSTHHD